MIRRRLSGHTPLCSSLFKAGLTSRAHYRAAAPTCLRRKNASRNSREPEYTLRRKTNTGALLEAAPIVLIDRGLAKLADEGCEFCQRPVRFLPLRHVAEHV